MWFSISSPEPPLWSAEFRPSGIRRVAIGILLSIWLIGWVAGEYIALRTLIPAMIAVVAGWVSYRSVSSPVLPGALFTLAWTTAWTIAGVAASYHALRNLLGRDVVEAHSEGIRLRRCAGPVTLSRFVQRDALRGMILARQSGALILTTARGEVMVTSWGTEPERVRARDRLRELYPALAGPWTQLEEIPQGLRLVPSEDGELVVRPYPQLPLWIHEWRVLPGALEIRQGFGRDAPVVRLESPRLSIERSTDGEGESGFHLVAREGGRRLDLFHCSESPAAALAVGHWLAGRLGVELWTGQDVLAA